MPSSFPGATLAKEFAESYYMESVSIPRLLSEARDQTQLFVREEFELAKAELSEKASRYRSAGTQFGVGAFVAYAALLVLLGGLALVLSFLLQSLGLDLLPSRSAGFGGIGLLVIVFGAVMVLKGVQSLRKQSVSPQKTLYTINRIKGIDVHQPAPKSAPPRRKSKDVQADIFATQQRLGTHAQALVQRLSPTHYLGMVIRRAQVHPVRWNLGALAAGFAGSVWFVKKLKR